MTQTPEALEHLIHVLEELYRFASRSTVKMRDISGTLQFLKEALSDLPGTDPAQLRDLRTRFARLQTRFQNFRPTSGDDSDHSLRKIEAKIWDWVGDQKYDHRIWIKLECLDRGSRETLGQGEGNRELPKDPRELKAALKRPRGRPRKGESSSFENGSVAPPLAESSSANASVAPPLAQASSRVEIGDDPLRRKNAPNGLPEELTVTKLLMRVSKGLPAAAWYGTADFQRDGLGLGVFALEGRVGSHSLVVPGKFCQWWADGEWRVVAEQALLTRFAKQGDEVAREKLAEIQKAGGWKETGLTRLRRWLELRPEFREPGSQADDQADVPLL